MKRLLVIAGLLITLCNVGTGVAYACKCFDPYGNGCEGDICWLDANERCHCAAEQI